jgi:VIT1/CCC1 family predicted Fe2+/Mn2+ transporter
VMFLSYFGAGLIVLAPYFCFPPTVAVGWSIAASLVTLFLLGVISARASGLPILARCFRMMLSGGIAIGIGALVARVAGTHITP